MGENQAGLAGPPCSAIGRFGFRPQGPPWSRRFLPSGTQEAIPTARKPYTSSRAGDLVSSIVFDTIGKPGAASSCLTGQSISTLIRGRGCTLLFGDGAPLERFVGLAKMTQYEEAAETSLWRLGRNQVGGVRHPSGKRENRPEAERCPGGDRQGRRRGEVEKEGRIHPDHGQEMRTAGVVGHHARNIYYMMAPENNFKRGRSVLLGPL